MRKVAEMNEAVPTLRKVREGWGTPIARGAGVRAAVVGVFERRALGRGNQRGKPLCGGD